jgi:Tol biopolymer transport system component
LLSYILLTFLRDMCHAHGMLLHVCLAAATILSANPTGHIAFVRGSEQEDHQVCILDITTRAVTPIGPGQRDGAPAWSPDGSRLAFRSHNEGGMRICIYNADGTEGPRIAHNHEWQQRPRWSPDGKRLAYSAGITPDEVLVVFDLESGKESIWGGGRKGLMRPVWLSNTAIIAIGILDEDAPNKTDLFTVTENGTGQVEEPGLSQNRTFRWAAEPEPHTGVIAFESNTDTGDREVFSFGSDTGIVNVSNHPAADWNPVWSPAADWLAFVSFRGNRQGVYRVSPSGGPVAPIAAAEDSDNWHPSWSPDGRWLAFVSNRTGDPEIFVGDAEGGTAVQMTDHPGHDYAPAWRPARGKEAKP